MGMERVSPTCIQLPRQKHEIVLEDKYNETPGKLLHIVSDAFVHTEAEQVTGAWCIFKTRDAK